MKAKSPARLVRWALRLAEFDFEIKYRKGSENSNADCLSRLLVIDHQESTTEQLRWKQEQLKDSGQEHLINKNSRWYCTFTV